MKKKKKKNTPAPSQQTKKEEDKGQYFMTLQEFEDVVAKREIQQKMQTVVQEAYQNKEEVLSKLFQKLKLTLTKEAKVNYQFLLSFSVDAIRTNLTAHKLSSEKLPLELSLQNPYHVVAEKMKSRCEFLLRLDTH